jgi:hypothetical protein
MRKINFMRVISILPVLILLAVTGMADDQRGTYVESPVADTDRPGNDYKVFYTNNEWDCHEACANDPKCITWTFVKPGYQGPKGRCYLKNAVSPEVTNKCCMSGFICRPLTFATTSPLPSAVIGGDYKYQIKISTGGFPPYEFYPMRVPSDGTPPRVDKSRDQRFSMPLGLKLSLDGLISGQVQSDQAGYIPLLIQVRDSCPHLPYQHVITKKFFINIKQQP